MSGYQVIADGTAWVDADGRDEFDLPEAEALAEVVEKQGYRVEIYPACHHLEHP